MPETKPIEHLAERKVKITGRIHKIESIQTLKAGFKQRFMLHIPELTDEMSGRTIRREQYYWVEIYSKDARDKRFLDASAMRSLKSCAVYLNSYHWMDPKDGLNAVPRLNFIEWLKANSI